jgi:hypothetical protein
VVTLARVAGMRAALVFEQFWVGCVKTPSIPVNASQSPESRPLNPEVAMHPESRARFVRTLSD